MVRSLAASMLVALVVASGCGEGAGLQAEAFEYGFRPDTWAVTAGEEVRVTLENTGGIGHDWVLLDLGPSVETFTDLSPDRVLARVEEVPAGETVSVTFTAPSQPGTYQVICSIPGHLEQGMRGTLTVSGP